MNLNAFERALSRRSLGRFAQAMMPGYELSRCHRLMIEFLEKLISGEIKRLALVLPPQTGKSTIGNTLASAYILGRNPKEKIISVAYGEQLAMTWGSRVKSYLENPLFKELFPRCRLSPDSQARDYFETTAGGQYTATGRSGVITGKGATLAICDDIIKNAEEASSDATCSSVIEWYQSTLATRLSKDGRILCVGTRWSEKDFMGFILRQPGFVVLRLPAFADSADDPLGRSLGEALWPSQFPVEVLEQRRAEVGSKHFQVEYQGRPDVAGGTIFRRDWFRRYVPSSSDRYIKLITSWDTSFGKSNQSDFSVGITIGQKRNGFDVLGLVRGRWDFPTLKAKVAFEAEFWKPDEILIEDAGSGTSVIQELADASSVPVIGIKPDRSKEARANACTPFFESGRVFFPENTDWVTGLEDELCGFPDGVPNDDRVDALCQALNRLRGATGVYAVVEWGMQQLKAPTRVIAFPSPATTPHSCQNHHKQNIPGGGARCQNCGEDWNPRFNPLGPPCDCGDSRLHIVIAGGQFRCNNSGRQWWPTGLEPRQPYRQTRKDVPRTG